MRSIIAIALAMGISSFTLAADNAHRLQAAIPEHRAQPAAPEWRPILKEKHPAIKRIPRQTRSINQGGNTLLGFGNTKQRRYGHRRHINSGNFKHRGYGYSRHKYRDLSSHWGISFSKHRKFGHESKHRKFGLSLYGSLGYFWYQHH